MIIMQGQADLLQVVDTLPRRAASRADCTAGNKSEIKTAIIAITTSNSMRVKARGDLARMIGTSFKM